MAQYKVIQDIEAEDKLLGPLSLRQFIYAGGAAFLGYLSFLAVAKGVPFLLAGFVPPMLFCMFFAWPWSPDQPTEVWALARIRFFLKPRRRIWDQSGAKDLVTITVPKKVAKIYTDGLSQVEVKSRLQALADTIDSRGWAVKNANVSMATLPTYDPASGSDRLVAATMLPQTVADIDVQADDDMLDEQNNPVAHQFDTMIHAASTAHRQQLLDTLRRDDGAAAAAASPAQPPATATKEQPADYWFLHQPSGPVAASNVVFANPQLVQPGSQQPIVTTSAPSASDEALAEQVLAEHHMEQPTQNMHLRTIDPIDPSAQATTTSQPPAATPVTPQPDAAILNLANNDDFDVATLARQARKARNPEPPEDEVVIPLH